MKLTKRSFVTAATTIFMIIVQNHMDGSPLLRSESVNTPCVCGGGGGGGSLSCLDVAA